MKVKNQTACLANIVHRLAAPLVLCVLMATACSNSDDEVTTPATVQNSPQISSFEPTSGIPGDSVVVKGRNFQLSPGVFSIAFGGVATTPPQIVSDTELVAVVPIGAISGTITATADNHTGSSSQGFTVLWEQVTYSGAAANYSSVCWTGSRFVAVGPFGAVLVSPDGLSWSRETVSPPVNLNSAAGNDLLIVAVGDGGSIFTSPNGTTWTPRSVSVSSSDDLVGIATDGQRFVAVARDRGYVITSSDGIVWQKHSLVASASMRFIMYTDRFVAVTARDTMWVSDNGTDWTLLHTNLIEPAVLGGAYSGKRTILVKPVSMLSVVDIITGSWTDITPSNNLMASFSDITWASLFFVAVGTSGIWSIDGSNWHLLADFPATPTADVHVASSADAVVAVGGFGNSIMIWRKPL